jgi:hypothetical protein
VPSEIEAQAVREGGYWWMRSRDKLYVVLIRDGVVHYPSCYGKVPLQMESVYQAGLRVVEKVADPKSEVVFF